MRQSPLRAGGSVGSYMRTAGARSLDGTLLRLFGDVYKGGSLFACDASHVMRIYVMNALNLCWHRNRIVLATQSW